MPCEICAGLPEDHPEWMKGMCENCYDAWAEAWRSAYSKRGD